MTGRKWIVTGGAGFIGSNTVRALAEHGIKAVVLDNLARPSAPLNVEWLRAELGDALEILPVDIREPELVDQAFADHADAETVLHLAAQVAVTTSIVDPREDFEVNALGSFNVLEATRRHTPDAAFLYVSTNKVYGDLSGHVIDEAATRYVDASYPGGIPETHQLDPHSPYGCSKAIGDLYALDYARIYGVRAVSLRQSCIYGPRQFGIEDQGWVAWFAIAAALRRQITVFGTGKQVRDLLHVDDLVDLYVRVADRAEAVAGRAYNVGGGPENAVSLIEILGRLEERHGSLDLRHDEFRPADQFVFVADVSRAAADFGWRPRIGVAEGIEQLFDWVEQHAEAAALMLAA